MIRIFLALLFPFTVSAQQYFDKNKEQVKKELGEYAVKNKIADPVITETDSTLVLSIKEKAAEATFFTYGFDRLSGKCNYQVTTGGCDTCYKKYLKALLDKKSYNWRKINENQYISRFQDRLLIELPVEDNNRSFSLFKTQWTKQLYDMLLEN